MRRLVGSSLLVLAGLSASGVALADPPKPAPPLAAAAGTPSAGDLATARNALKEGLALRDKGDHAAALGRLTTAFDLVQTPVTAFELGKTHLLLGHVLQAHEMFQRVGRIPPALEESERSATARAEADKLASDLEPRIPTLRIHLKLPEGATASVRIDEDPITTVGAITPRAVDPGRHVIVARAGDGPEERVTLQIAESEIKDVELAPQWVPPKAPEPGAGQVVYLRQTNPWVFVGFTASSVALTVTGVSAVLAVNASSRAHEGCGEDYCPQHVRDDDITVMRSWIVATVIGAAATIGFFTVGVISIGKPTMEKVVSGVTVKGYVGAGSAGLTGRF
ncbi:MAG: hypothetical protein JWP97_1312 [Labilithrix sp.]|nr:hypothetical protein [Labilithrix sp.]